jgi:hypothetical protein
MSGFAEVRESNCRTVGLLTELTWEDLGDNQDVWKRLWNVQQWYVYQPEPEALSPPVSESVPLADVSVPHAIGAARGDR